RSAPPPTNNPLVLRKSPKPLAASPKLPKKSIPPSKNRRPAPRPLSAPWTRCANWYTNPRPVPPSFPPPPSRCSSFRATCSTAWIASFWTVPTSSARVAANRSAATAAVPSAPDLIEGVINLRGKIIPVMDLRKRFGETEIHADKKNRILVVELDNKLIGLIVNAASEVLKIPPSEIEAPGSVFAEGATG